MTLLEKKTDGRLKASLGPQGRIVIPSAIRKEFGWKEGTVLSFVVEDGQIVVSDQRAALKRLQDYMKPFIPEGTDILEDFLDERRRAVELENREDQ